MKIKNIKLVQFKHSFIELIQQASNLEGLGLTYGQTKEIIEIFDKSKKTYTWEEIEVVKGIRDAYQYISSIVESSENITYQDILNINRYINEYETSKDAGSWRKVRVQIKGSTYVPPIYTSAEYIDRINLTLNVPITFDSVVKLYADIAKMQFFKNGNKRSALCFCNAILIKNELDFIRIPSKSKFTDALVNYYENENKFNIFLNLVKKASVYDLNSFKNMTMQTLLVSKLKANNMSEADLAKKISVDRSYINHIISGRKIPSVEVAKKIGKVLELNWEKFFKDK